MKYEGKSVTLPEETEEIATFIAKTIDTDHFKDEIFRANLFRDWQHWLKVYPPEGGLQITDLNKCDFRPMADYFDAEKEVNKKKTAAEKKEWVVFASSLSRNSTDLPYP
jgi:DNA topoisomerase I